MSVHIKQIKGANDLIARDEFIRDNLQGKISFKDNNLILSVPLKVEKMSSGDIPDFSQLEEDDIVTKKYVDDSITNLKGAVSADYDTLKEIESKIKSISATTGAVPVSAQSDSNVGTKIGSISVGDDTINFYIDLGNYVQKSGINAAFDVAPTAPSISSAFDDNHLVTASFVHEIERKLIGVAENTLTTLSEISGAVDNDPDYYQKVRNALDNKLGKADISVEPATESGTLIGTIILNEDTHELKVDLSSLAPLNSPNFTGSPKVPDVAKGDKSSLVANTRFVTTAISDAVSSVKGSPPSNLDTLQKISSAVGNNPTFATDINSSLTSINTSVGNLNTSVDTAISSISALDSDKQPSNAALTSISKLSTAADRMIYTTAKDKYAVTTLTGSARTLISKSTVADMRSHLDVPQTNGTDAKGNWSITADRAVNDKDGNPIDTTYLKTANAVNVTVTNTVTGTDVTRLGTVTIGDTAHDINVDLSSYAPKASPAFTGKPTSSTPSLTDNTTRIATTGFVQSVVSGAISDLVGEGTPEALNTLKEISDVIGDSSDFTGAIISELGNKVSKVAGKGLSTNDFTDSYKNKLDGIAESANKYELPNATTSAKGGVIVGTGLSVNNGKVSVAAATTSAIGGIKLGNGVTTTTGGTVSIQSATASQNGLMTSSQASKLASIAAGAEVNVINTVKVNGTALVPDSNKTVDITMPDISSKVSLVAGAKNGTVNAAVTSPYINLTDDNANKGSVQITGAAPVTVSSDAKGIITVKSTNSTYSAGTGLSLSGSTFSADSGYLGSVQKGTDNNTFLRADGTWQTPPDTNTTYTAGTGISISSNKVNLAVAKSGTIGGVKVAAVATSNVSLGTDGSISVPLATTSQAGAVKVGTNLSVNNGTISLSSSNVTGALGFTPASSADVPAAATVMTGASASAAGKAGLVPAPAKGKQNSFLKGDGTWATVVSSDTTYTAGTGISLNGTTFSADSSYLGSIAKGTDTTKFLNNKGDWAVPPDTNTTYSAGNGLAVSSNSFSVKVPSNSGLSVTTNGVSVTAATGSAIGGVKIGAGISTGAGGLISIPAATTGANGLMTAAQVKAVESLNGATSNSVSLVAANSAAGTINATSTAGSTFVNLTDNKAVKGSIKIIGDGSVTVKSDTAGIVKISGTNTDTNDKVAQNISTADYTYPVLLSSTANATANVTANNVIFGSGVKINPSTNTLVLGKSSSEPGHITLYNGSQIGVNKGASFAGLMIGDAHAVSPTVGSDVIVNGSQKLILGSGENVLQRYNSTLSSSIAGGFEEDIIIASDSNIIINTNANKTNTLQTYSLSGGVFYSPKIQTGYINYEAVPIGNSLLATPINYNKGLILSTPGQLSFANAGAILSEIYATAYASLTAEELAAGKPHKVTDVSHDLRIRGSNALILQAGDGINPIGNYALPPTEPESTRSVVEQNSSLRHYGFNWDGSLIDYKLASYHSGEHMYLFADRSIVFSFNHQDQSTVPGTAYGLDDSIKVHTANKRAVLDYTDGYFYVRGIKTQKPVAVQYGGTGQTVLSAVTVGKASSLATAQNIIASLGSSVAASFNGSAAVTVGTQGTLPIANGGTGATTLQQARSNLGVITHSDLIVITYDSTSETPNKYAITIDNLTVEKGTMICVRFEGFATSGNTDDIYLNVNGSGYGKIVKYKGTYLKVNEAVAKHYYFLYYGNTSWLMNTVKSENVYMSANSYIGTAYGSGSGINGMKILEQYSTNSGNDVLVTGGQRLFLNAGDNFFSAYGVDSVSNYIAPKIADENVRIISDSGVTMWTGFTVNGHNEFAFSETGNCAITNNGIEIFKITNTGRVVVDKEIFFAGTENYIRHLKVPVTSYITIAADGTSSTGNQTISTDFEDMVISSDGRLFIFNGEVPRTRFGKKANNYLVYNWDDTTSFLDLMPSGSYLDDFVIHNQDSVTGTARSTENMYLASDANVIIYTNLQNTTDAANKVKANQVPNASLRQYKFAMNTDGSFEAPTINAGQVNTKLDYPNRILIPDALIANSVTSASFTVNYDYKGDSLSPSGGVEWRRNANGYSTGVYGVRPPEQSVNYTNNLMVTAPNSLILASGTHPGHNLLKYYGTDNMFITNFNQSNGGHIHVMAQSDVELLTNCSDYTVKPYRFLFNATGAAVFPNLQLTNPLAIKYGGTGATTASDALANLGVSTVSSDLALQAMGLGNGTGCYTCNISPTSATLTNDTTSPMTGFTLKDGATVYFCLKNTVSAATKAVLSFNGTSVHSAYSIKSGVSTSTVPASVLTTGFYKAIYHTSALSTSDANTWIFHKIN